MKKINLSILVSSLLIGSIVLTGCNNSNSSQQNDANVFTSQNLQTGVLTGKVKVTKSRNIKKVDQTTIVAYNLNTEETYQTTANSDGSYSFTLPEGNYQVIAVSPATTLKGIKLASVQRNTKTVVDIVLQAAGNIKGKIPNKYYYNEGYRFVTIPGTSYISSVDENGNFELINVPAGDEIIRFGKFEARVNVEGGKTVEVKDWQYLGNMYHTRNIPAVALKYEGLRFYYNGNLENLDSNIVLIDENNKTIPLVFEINDHHNYNNNNYSDEIFVKTKDIIKPGKYYLTYKDSYNNYKQIINVTNKIAVVDFSDEEGGFFVRKMGVAFSTAPKDFNSSLITITDKEGNALQNINVKKTQYPNIYEINADFDPNKKYTVTFDSSIKNDGIVYINQFDNFSENGIYIGKVDINYVSVENNKNVYPSNHINFTIKNSDALDLKTLQVTLNGKEYNISSLNYSSNNNYYHDDDISYAHFSFKPDLEYAKEYNLTITAKDIYGKDALNKTVQFATLTPKVVGVEPYDDTNIIEAGDLLDEARNGLLKAYFNIPDIDYKSGKITLHDDTNNVDIPTKPFYYDERYPNSVNIETKYMVAFEPKSLKPDTTYTMTVSGFKTKDGYTTVADKTYTFTTGHKQLVAMNIENAQYVNAEDLNNRLEFFFFGGLSDDQKNKLKNGINITSFENSLKTDETHPAPEVLFEDNEFGTNMVLAFTIDPGKSYEINLPSDIAKEFNANTKLEFMTVSQQPSTETKITWNIITDYSLRDNFDYNLSKNDFIYDEFSVRLQVPVKISKSYYINENGQSVSIYNYCNNVDKNTSKALSWISGKDINVTEDFAFSSVKSRYYYDENGNYQGYYYVCYVNYDIEGNMPYNKNNTLTVNVPENEIAENISVKDNPFTIKKTFSIEPGLHYDISVSPYAGEYDKYTGVAVYFDKPVEIDTLKNLQIAINPEVDYNKNIYNQYITNDQNFTNEVYITMDKSNYTAFEIEINGSVKYFDIDGNIKDKNVSISKIIYTTGDYKPLEYVNNPVITDNRNILVTFNAPVETGSILNNETNTSAYEVVEKDTNKTIGIVSVDTGNCYYEDECNIFLQLSEDLNSSKTYILKQTGEIKKQGSIYTIKPGEEWELNWQD